MHYLHTRPRPVIHYDLKPGNILFHNAEIRLTDFGLSKVMDDTGIGESQMELTSQGAGTYWYLPPECFVQVRSGCKSQPATVFCASHARWQGSEARISPKVDVWSVGVVYFQLLFGRRPFADEMSQQTILTKNLINQGTVVEFPSKPAVSEGCRHIISAMLTTDARMRPTIEDLLNHPYMQKKKVAKATATGSGGGGGAGAAGAKFKEPLPPAPAKSGQ